jgi:serine/threonine protein kinase
MAEPHDSPGYLIHLAAEGMAPVIAGCAGSLAAQVKSEGAGHFPVKGIDYFGPRIIEKWLGDVRGRPQAEQLAMLSSLATLSAADGRQEAAAAVDRAATGASPEDRAIAVEYLAAIPLSVRRSLVPDAGSGRLILPPTFTTDNEGAFYRLLPADVPPFPIDYVLPGTSYRLEELLGIGGFGAVYKARNRFEQNRPPLAIKFCLDASMVATLHREQAILDRLMAVGGTSWSNRIVRLYGYALDVQPPFLVYEFVPGGDLTSHLTMERQKTGRGFRPVVALALVRQVAEALAFAHNQGLVHRDLKPANVLVSGSTIKLTDFGIGGVVAAHAARSSFVGGSALTPQSAAGQASLFRGSGTPLYMSAEQRRGDHPDPRHDLYSLGVVWYQLLVGDVTRELSPGWADELMEEYQTPKENIELIQRCVGYFKKRPANAGELLDLLPAAPRPIQAPATPAAPGPARPPAVDSTRLAVEFAQLKALLTEQIDRDAFRDARTTLSAMLRLKHDDAELLEVRTFIDGRLGGPPPREVLCLTEHQGWVRSVAMTPDGSRALSGGDDATVRLWSLQNGRLLQTLTGHSGAVMSVALSADGHRGLSGSWDGTLRLWDLNAGRLLRCWEGTWKGIKAVAINPDGRRGLSGSADHCVRLWDLESGQELYCLQGHTDLVQAVAIAADGRLAVSGADDNTVRLWDLQAGRELRCFTGHTDSITSVALFPHGRGILSGSSDHTVRQWDLTSGREIRCFRGHANWVNSVAITGDGSRIFTGSGGQMRDGHFQDGIDTTVRLWDMTSGRELVRFEGHTASVSSVAISADGQRGLSGGLDKTGRLWDLPR